MAYVWGCCLRGKKFKQFDQASGRVSKNLDLATLFKAVNNSREVGD